MQRRGQQGKETGGKLDEHAIESVNGAPEAKITRERAEAVYPFEEEAIIARPRKDVGCSDNGKEVEMKNENQVEMDVTKWKIQTTPDNGEKSKTV